MDRENLKKRFYTACVLGAIMLAVAILAALWCPGKWFLTGITVLAISFAAFEFAGFSGQGFGPRAMLNFFLTFLPALVVALSFWPQGMCGFEHEFFGGTVAVTFFFVSCVFAILLMALGSRSTLEGALEKSRGIYLALILIGLGGGMLVAITALPTSYFIIWWLIFVVGFNDIAAYFAGSRFGGPKIAPIVSPNKTVSGSLAGLLVGVLVGVVLLGFLPYSQTIISSLVLSTAVVISAQAGDLAQSYLKRIYGVKESGKLLPGHGGILDRIDGMLFAAPVLYGFLMLTNSIP